MPTDLTCRRLFVYGTLRRGVGHPMHQTLARSADFVGDGRLPADLYDLGDYPGIVLNPAAGQGVSGEVYELRADAAGPAWRTLDGYEMCGEADARPHLYHRQIVSVDLADGSAVDAWAYVLRRIPLTAVAVYGGDYLAWKAAAMA